MRDKYWIQKAIKKPNRVRTYVKRLFGEKAFDEKGRIKLQYLYKARKEAKANNNTSLVRAIDLAIRLKRL